MCSAGLTPVFPKDRLHDCCDFASARLPFQGRWRSGNSSLILIAEKRIVGGCQSGGLRMDRASLARDSDTHLLNQIGGGGGLVGGRRERQR